MFRCAELAFDDQTVLGRIVRRAFEGLHKLVHHTRGLNDKPLLRRGAVGTAWTVADFTCAVVKGIITHGLVVSDRRRESDPRGKDPDSAWGSYDRIDRWDFREWLGIYGASPETQGSPLVRMIYDAAFSYENGGHLDPETGELDGERMAAGTVLRIMLLMGFTYKHAFYFKMRAGMGDVIAAPLYEVLRRRNVKFKFFNRLTGVKLGDDGQGNRVVEELQLTELARTRQGADYRPLEDEAGLLTWPAKPHEDQIEPGDYEDACNADRYLYKSAQPRPCKSLVVGHDFDVVILGIPASCIPYACPALVEEGAKAAQATSGVVVDPKSRWADVPALAATQTIALQLWFKLSLEELGWHRSPPLLSLFYDPLNTWCDMGQTLGQERWPEGDRPRSVAYFCGPLPHQTPLPTPDELRRTSRAALARLDATIRAQGDEAVAGLLDTLEQLLPNVRGPLNAATPNFNWSLLTDPQHRRGSGRLAAQYVRVNYEPSERCTLALPGQTALRIEAGATGYANLVVTGDWIKNGIHAACFEGAVQSGIRAARAVSTNPALYVIRAERLLGLDSRTPTSPAWSPVPSTRGKRKRERKAPPPELGTTV
jgi:hypothetical protein